jgi:hypothetical protein
MKNIVKKGNNTIAEHLRHLDSHGEVKYYKQAIEYLNNNGIEVPEHKNKKKTFVCPSTIAKRLREKEKNSEETEGAGNASYLGVWPVQLKLVSVHASFFDHCDLLIAADCTGFAYGDIQRRFIKGRIPLIFCPKLDSGAEDYIEKLAEIFRRHSIQSVTVLRMQVPCCGGTSIILERAMKMAGVDIDVKEYIISPAGEII